MSYAYGMRFDDDSNAITVIDEDNQTAVTTGYIDGEYVEFAGGNPNRVQTITGTVADLGIQADLFALISEGIIHNNVTAIMAITVGEQTGSVDLGAGNEGTQLYGVASAFNDDNFLTMRVIWNLFNGNIIVGNFESIQGANNAYQVTDLKSMASMCTTELTIIWHPLP